jgi:CubicO group peptidase (beta-lactamase class C family)
MKVVAKRLSELLIAWLVALPLPGQTGPPPDLDGYVFRSMQTFEVPGLSIAIVKDGRVVLAKRYGVCKMGESVPVDENTLFGIGCVLAY